MPTTKHLTGKIADTAVTLARCRVKGQSAEAKPGLGLLVGFEEIRAEALCRGGN
jgi:hypothetical protein